MTENEVITNNEYGRKYFTKKQEINEFVLAKFQDYMNQTSDPETTARFDRIVKGPGKDEFMAIPKMVTRIIDYMVEFDKQMVFRLIADDATNMVRHLRDTNPSDLEWFYNNLPVIVVPEKCVCGSTPIVSPDGTHNCPNPDCLVNKCNVSATLEKWNELMLGTKGKKVEKEPDPVPVVPEQPGETLSDLLTEI